MNDHESATITAMDTMERGLNQMTKRAEAVTHALASLRAECGALAEMVTASSDTECLDYLQKELKRIAATKP